MLDKLEALARAAQEPERGYSLELLRLELTPRRILALIAVVRAAEKWQQEYRRVPYDVEAAIISDGELDAAIDAALKDANV